ncbi:MAG: rod shape-determining protein RodA [Bacteroidaceae bacterium]|nr:rod shape-determining protein RodA [Bacteroidaceae bacterium]MBQ6693902.1 rod shape-determining protein RodA [Bacteroidaceae bacterium]
MERERDSIFHRIDWITVLLYLALGIMGWFAICGASYSYIETDLMEFLSPAVRTGKQAMWMGVSMLIGAVLLCVDKRVYKDWAYIVYVFFILLGILTIFIAKDIKGSHSWISIGSFSLQPAEFMKFATTLALAAFMNKRGFDIKNKADFIKSVVIFLLPMVVIVGQRETGSALVYLAFSIVLYREGMTGILLLMALSAVVLFVVGIRYEAVMFETLPLSVGHYAVLVLVQIFSLAMIKFWCKHDKTFLTLLAVNFVGTLAAYWTAVYLISFNIILFQYLLIAFNIVYMLFAARVRKEIGNIWVALYVVGALAFYSSCDYVMHNVLLEHQRVRIEVLLGLKEELSGAGYNVHQSKIAIGSGGITGKGFLNGTQTKLKYVPEQDTDFIFCTIGEEQGFVGSTAVIVIFAAFILRLIGLAERQNDRFGRVYGYSLASIFFFHFSINVGMVLGIMPVIGIPLPFFSYGGSSFLGFSILLFSFLRIDADRNVRV